MIVRHEVPDDADAIHHVTVQAFGRVKEAKLIEALREHDKVILSLVAVHEGQIVGHVLFFPVVIEAERGNYDAVGLGPLAVLPRFQGQGFGSALVRAGLDELRKGAHAAVIVLGHAKFYPRFGFVPASTYGLRSRYDVPDDVFMALELSANGLTGKSGPVVYSAEFDGV